MTDAGIADRSSPLRPVIVLATALAAAALIVLAAQQGFVVASAWSGLSSLGQAASEALFTLVLFGALLAVAIVGLRADGRLHGLAGAEALPMGARGVAIGLAGLFAETGCAALAGVVHRGGGTATAEGLVLGTIAVLFQSAVEEVYFRGWLQPALARSWGTLAGLLVAAATFAALHLAGGARSPLTLANLFLGGVLFGLLALRGRGLAAPIAAHFAWNWGEQILLGLDPNPGTGSFGALVNLDLVGNPLWGGSGEGLNASMAMSVVLVALIVPIAAWRPRRDAQLHS